MARTCSITDLSWLGSTPVQGKREGGGREGEGVRGREGEEVRGREGEEVRGREEGGGRREGRRGSGRERE